MIVFLFIWSYQWIWFPMRNIQVNTWHPRSPSPKIRSPSVTTITWILLSGQFFNTSRTFPLKKGKQLNDPALKCSPKLHTSHMNKEIYTSLSNLWKDPEDAWRCSHISGKPHQQQEYTQLEAVPQHDQLEVCKTAFHSSPVYQHNMFHFSEQEE